MKTSLELVPTLIDRTMQIAQVVSCTEAEGPGKRFAIWFQGCPLRCPGCCNPEFLPFQGGETWAMTRMIVEIEQAQHESEIEGLSLLGGEPFAHANAGAELAKAARRLGLSVMIYSGYTLEALHAKSDPEITELLAHTDLLVDGPYLHERPDKTRRWIGSTNQRIHFLTERYQSDDPCWHQRNTLEIRLRGSELAINGFPAVNAVGLWKGWKRKR